MSSRTERRLLASAVGIVVIGCLALSRAVFDDVPHGGDAVAYAFQAKVFASGRAAAPGTPIPECFWVDNVVNWTERRFCVYPPGWPLLFAPFVALGAPQLANASLAGLAALLVWILARRLIGPCEGWLALGLAILSPFFTFMGASTMAHMACAAASLGMTVALLRALDAEAPRARARWGALSGAAAGVAITIRPLSGALCGLGAVWIAAWIVRVPARRWLGVVLAALPPLAASALLFALYNVRTTGSPLLLAYRLPEFDVSFLGERGMLRASVWENLAANAPRFFRALNRETWGWPFPDLWPLAALAILRPRDRRTWALIGAILLFLVGESCYHYFDLAFGPRLAFESLPWILIATAFAFTSLFDAVGSRARTVAWRGVLVGLLALQSIAGAVALYPKLARYYSSIYCGHGPELARAVDERRIHDAIVFVDAERGREFAYGSLFLRNALDVGASDVIFARFVPELVAPMAARFPRREYWLLRVAYEALPGRNTYADRFRITRLDLNPIALAPAQGAP